MQANISYTTVSSVSFHRVRAKTNHAVIASGRSHATMFACVRLFMFMCANQNNSVNVYRAETSIEYIWFQRWIPSGNVDQEWNQSNNYEARWQTMRWAVIRNSIRDWNTQTIIQRTVEHHFGREKEENQMSVTCKQSESLYYLAYMYAKDCLAGVFLTRKFACIQINKHRLTYPHMCVQFLVLSFCMLLLLLNLTSHMFVESAYIQK